MIKEQCISVTDLKRDTKNILASLKGHWPKVIFINNRPVAVLTDIDETDLTIQEEDFHFYFWEEWIDPKEILDHFKK